jgi:hypothetical protein
MVVTKAPLTGAIANSNAGGYFPAELKFAGYDMIIFEGRAAGRSGVGAVMGSKKQEFPSYEPGADRDMPWAMPPQTGADAISARKFTAWNFLVFPF